MFTIPLIVSFRLVNKVIGNKLTRASVSALPTPIGYSKHTEWWKPKINSTCHRAYSAGRLMLFSRRYFDLLSVHRDFKHNILVNVTTLPNTLLQDPKYTTIYPIRYHTSMYYASVHSILISECQEKSFFRSPGSMLYTNPGDFSTNYKFYYAMEHNFRVTPHDYFTVAIFRTNCQKQVWPCEDSSSVIKIDSIFTRSSSLRITKC